MAFIRQLGPVAVSWTVGQTDRRILHSDATGALLTSATHPSTPAGLIWTPTLDQYDKVAIEIQFLKTAGTGAFPVAWGTSKFQVWGVGSEDSKAFLRVADNVGGGTSLPYAILANVAAGHELDLVATAVQTLVLASYTTGTVSNATILVSSRLNNEGIKPFVMVGYTFAFTPGGAAPNDTHTFLMSIREYGSHRK